MLSRVANSIYWISRYIERAENYARSIEVSKNLMLDLPSEINEQWQPLIMVTGDQYLFESKYDSYTKNNVIKFLATDTHNPNSIISCILKARENARTVQEVINSDMWQQINELYLTIKERLLKRNWDNSTLNEFLSEITKGSHLFCGIMDSTFSHSEAWQFAYLGRMLERADKTVRIIDMNNYYQFDGDEKIKNSIDVLQWSALLKSVSAYEMYRKNYSSFKITNIIDYLLFSNNFPRAVRYSVVRAERSLHMITGNQTFAFSCDGEKEIGKLRSMLEFMDVSEVYEQGLHEFSLEVIGKLDFISKRISEKFFSI